MGSCVELGRCYTNKGTSTNKHIEYDNLSKYKSLLLAYFGSDVIFETTFVPTPLALEIKRMDCIVHFDNGSIIQAKGYAYNITNTSCDLENIATNDKYHSYTIVLYGMI